MLRREGSSPSLGTSIDPWSNGRTLGFGPGGWGSNPCGSTMSRFAKWLRHQIVVLAYAGSNPVPGPIFDSLAQQDRASDF